MDRGCTLRFCASFRPSALLILLPVSLVVGCTTSPSVEPGLAPDRASTVMSQQGYSSTLPSSYALRPSDRVSISVFREADLALEDAPISADGRLSFPLVGSLVVAGMTPLELEDRLEELLGSRYLRNPDVTVNVLDYASHLVTVDGQVTQPGVYPFSPGARLSGGISLARGLTRVASTSDIIVFRQGPEGLQVAKFDYSSVRAGQMLDPVLMPGDRVVVGTDGLSQFWQDFLRAVPVVAIFTNTF